VGTTLSPTEIQTVFILLVGGFRLDFKQYVTQLHFIYKR